MQTVNFQCGNCNKLMGVSAEFLGQQVRCPHCQAVVVAPAAPVPAAPSQPAPADFSSLGNQQDDIFAPPEPIDDLFGNAEAPRVELPPVFEEPALASNGDGNAAPQPAAAGFGSTMAYSPESAPIQSAGAGAIPSWMDSPAPAPAPTAPSFTTEPAAETHEETIPHLIRRPRDGGGWFAGLVVIPLISYALLATIAVLMLWYRMQQAPPPGPNPLDVLPSFDPNDDDHSTHLKPNQRMSRIRDMDVKRATSPLLPERITRLGEKLQVGDLEITPLNVDRRRVSVISKGSQPEPCRALSLLLHLKLKNISSNVVFQPMDVYFDRKWRSKSDQPPLTILELLDSAPAIRFFGGPAEYHPPPLPNNIHAQPPQEVEGDHGARVLRPGDEMETFVCTDGDDKAAVDAVDGYHGKLLWRVHLRRGIITVDANHLVPVSSVVGVEFTDDDYRKSS